VWAECGDKYLTKYDNGFCFDRDNNFYGNEWLGRNAKGFLKMAKTIENIWIAFRFYCGRLDLRFIVDFGLEF